VIDRWTTNSVTKDFIYTCNLGGSVWKITYPSARTIEYHPTAAGRVKWAKDIDQFRFRSSGSAKFSWSLSAPGV
jgi:hypothetical protein